MNGASGDGKAEALFGNEKAPRWAKGLSSFDIDRYPIVMVKLWPFTVTVKVPSQDPVP